MKISNKLKIALKSMLSIKCGEVVTNEATLIWDGEEDMAEGIEVYVKDENDELLPAKDGDYTTEDGKVITVVDGKVASIKDPEAEVAPDAMEEAVEEVATEEVVSEEMAEEEPKPADEPENEEGPKDEERIAALEARLAEFTDGLNQVLNAIAALEGRIAEVEGKVARVEAEPAAEPAEEPTAEEAEMHKTKMSYLRRK